MKNLIFKFQHALEISKTNAITRVVTFFLFFALFVSTAMITLWNFPYRPYYPETEITLQKGNYEPVVEISGVHIKLMEYQFYEKINKDGTLFISLDNYGTAKFFAVQDGVSFFFEKEIINRSIFYNFSIKEIKNETLVIYGERSNSHMILGGIIVPLAFCFLFLLFSYVLQTKSTGYGYDSNRRYGKQYIYVWI